MTAAGEDWVKAALVDDAMVVKLLVRLRGAGGCAGRPLLEWSVRQRRSKSVSSVVGYGQKKAQADRASPATPLSWSGGTSLSGGSGGSGGGGGEESSSRPPIRKPSPVARSKDRGPEDNDNSAKNVTKRPRKKMTLTELKEEENLLQQEKRKLKREINALCVNLEKQRSINENLKRMKIELSPPNRLAPMADESIPDQPKHKAAAQEIPYAPSGVCDKPSEFFLPDLNVPFDDDPV